MRRPVKPTRTAEILRTVGLGRLHHIMGATTALVDGEWVPWEEVRWLVHPDGLTAEEWWLGIKLSRRQLARRVPLRDARGGHFSFATPDAVLQGLHEIEEFASGRVPIGDAVTNPHTRERYRFDALVEEAVTSSQLEGVTTPSGVAREMLRTARRPADHDERIIADNYLAMKFVRKRAGDILTPDLLLELYAVVTGDTHEESGMTGRMLEAMCDFANADDADDGPFVHPVIRAVILHFWMAHEHPVVIGNGRMARALFYWSMLSRGYWLADYISISGVLLKEQARYGRSFLYPRADENDLTYFVLYQLGVIQRAIDALRRHLDGKVVEAKWIGARLRQPAEFNHRQRTILGHAMRRPGARYTIGGHRRRHGVAYDTARTDLLELAEAGLLAREVRGRAYVFVAPEDLEEKLEG